MTTAYSIKFKSQGYLSSNSYPKAPASSDTTVVSIVASSNGYDMLVQSYSKAGTATVTWTDQSGPQTATVTVEAAIGAGRISVPGSPLGVQATPGGLRLVRD